MVLPDVEQFWTDVPAQIERGGSRISAVGMDYDNIKRTMKFRSKVRGTVEPAAGDRAEQSSMNRPGLRLRSRSPCLSPPSPSGPTATNRSITRRRAANATTCSKICVLVGEVVLVKGTMRATGERVQIRKDPEGYQYGLIQGAPGKLATFRQRRDASQPGSRSTSRGTPSASNTTRRRIR